MRNHRDGFSAMGKAGFIVHVAVRGFRTGTYRGDPGQFGGGGDAGDGAKDMEGVQPFSVFIELRDTLSWSLTSIRRSIDQRLTGV